MVDEKFFVSFCFVAGTTSFKSREPVRNVSFPQFLLFHECMNLIILGQGINFGTLL